MNILAIDASTKASGYAIFDLDTKELIDYGVIKSASKNIYERISHMKQEISKIIKQYSITQLVLEEVPSMGNTHTQQVLFNLQGVILVEAYEIDSAIIFNLLQSSSWRSKCGISTGRGIKRSELKQADIDFANSTYNLTLTDDDIADAIGLGHAFLYGKQDHNWK